MKFLKSHKRITIFAGHYGSGKTNIAVNYAKELKKKGESVLVADLDIVNPYFRTKDSEEELKTLGIDLICSEFASTNLDIPALPKDLYRIINDKSTCAVIDVGGDDAGSIVLGRLAPGITQENDFEMIFVVNFFRPVTRTAEEAMKIMKEIEAVSSLKFTAIVNNSNLGEMTSDEDILSTKKELEKLSKISSLPLLFTSAKSNICDKLAETEDNLFPLKLQKKLF